MSEEKDEFLREIDELLGEDSEDPMPFGATVDTLANVSTPGQNGTDLEVAGTLKGLSVQSNHQEALPKTG